MSFDMSQCKKGDKLVCRNGAIAEYIRCISNYTYNHILMVKDLTGDWRMSVTSVGEMFAYTSSEYDIIGFYKEESKMIERDKEYDLKVTGEQLALIYLIIGKTNGGWGSKSSLYEAVENLLFNNLQISDIHDVNIDISDLFHSKYQINNWLDKIFTKEETPLQKEFKELQLQIQQLQDKANAVEQKIKG